MERISEYIEVSSLRIDKCLQVVSRVTTVVSEVSVFETQVSDEEEEEKSFNF